MSDERPLSGALFRVWDERFDTMVDAVETDGGLNQRVCGLPDVMAAFPDVWGISSYLMGGLDNATGAVGDATVATVNLGKDATVATATLGKDATFALGDAAVATAALGKDATVKTAALGKNATIKTAALGKDATIALGDATVALGSATVDHGEYVAASIIVPSEDVATLADLTIRHRTISIVHVGDCGSPRRCTPAEESGGGSADDHHPHPRRGPGRRWLPLGSTAHLAQAERHRFSLKRHVRLTAEQSSTLPAIAHAFVGVWSHRSAANYDAFLVRAPRHGHAPCSPFLDSIAFAHANPHIVAHTLAAYALLLVLLNSLLAVGGDWLILGNAQNRRAHPYLPRVYPS